MEQTDKTAMPAGAPDAAETKKAFSRVGFALLALVVLATVFQFVLAIPLYFIAALQSAGWYLWVMTFAPIYLIAFPAAVFILRKLPAQKPEQHSLKPAALLGAFAVSMAAMWLGGLIGSGLSALFTGGQAINPLGNYVSQTSVLSVLFTVFIAPIIEETLFRRILIDRLARYGGALAVLMSGFTFALFHMNLFQFFYAFAIGLVLAYVYYRTGRILYAIGLHMVINLMGGVISVNAMAAGQTGTTAGKAAMYAYLVALYALVIGGIATLIRARKSIRFDADETPLAKGFGRALKNAGMIWYVGFCVVAMAFVLFSANLAAMLAG